MGRQEGIGGVEAVQDGPRGRVDQDDQPAGGLHAPNQAVECDFPLCACPQNAVPAGAEGDQRVDDVQRVGRIGVEDLRHEVFADSQLVAYRRIGRNADGIGAVGGHELGWEDCRLARRHCSERACQPDQLNRHRCRRVVGVHDCRDRLARLGEEREIVLITGEVDQPRVVIAFGHQPAQRLKAFKVVGAALSCVESEVDEEIPAGCAVARSVRRNRPGHRLTVEVVAHQVLELPVAAVKRQRVVVLRQVLEFERQIPDAGCGIVAVAQRRRCVSAAQHANERYIGRIGRQQSFVEIRRVDQLAVRRDRNHLAFLDRAADHARPGQVDDKRAGERFDGRTLHVQDRPGGDLDGTLAFRQAGGQVEDHGVAVDEGEAGRDGVAVDQQVTRLQAGKQHGVIKVHGEGRRRGRQPLAVRRVRFAHFKRRQIACGTLDFEVVFSTALRIQRGGCDSHAISPGHGCRMVDRGIPVVEGVVVAIH